MLLHTFGKEFFYMRNKSRKITETMTMKLAFHSLTNGNLEIATLLSKMLDSEPMQRVLNVLALDELGIYGEQLYCFLTVCCLSDYELVNATLLAYREGYLSEDEILRDIKKGKPILEKVD